MEIVIFVVCAIVAMSCLSANLLIAYMIWQHWHDRKVEPAAPVMPEETPEEKEARLTAMRAQQAYDQGLINVMSYMGQFSKKGREDI